jgi:hypothetical protein
MPKQIIPKKQIMMSPPLLRQPSPEPRGAPARTGADVIHIKFPAKISTDVMQFDVASRERSFLGNAPQEVGDCISAAADPAGFLVVNEKRASHRLVGILHAFSNE